jgi:hypothetical protein
MAEMPSVIRKIGGVVVTDLVGSTALRVRLGEDVADEVWRRHQKLLVDIIERHCGRVVSWLGDGVLVVTPSASSAVLAAIGIQQAVTRENQRPVCSTEIAVRIGVSGGELELAGDQCRGQPVVEAQDLCRAAGSGEILATPIALDLAGGRTRLTTRDANGARSVEWHPLAGMARQLGLPNALQIEVPFPLVGREQVIAALDDALAAASSGEPRMALLVGEAGIGKTRLAVEFGRRAFAKGAVVLYGAVQEHLSLPYDPIPRLLRDWVARVQDLVMRLGPRAGELVRLLPELRDAVPGLPPPTPSDAETERLRMYDAVGEWVSMLTFDDPVVILLDSLHRADNTTLDLVRHLLPMLRDSRVLLVTTQRPDREQQIDMQRQCGEEAFGSHAVSVIRLQGLTTGPIDQLLRHVAGGQSQITLASALQILTGGNPLHLAEILRVPAGSAEPPDLPRTVRALIRANVAKLDEGARLTLEAAAVLGEEFDAPLLAQIVADPNACYQSLDAAVRAGLLRELDRQTLRYGFAHILTWETVYEGIGAARQARLHECAGLALERLDARATDSRLAELARHFAAALPVGQRERAGHYAGRAAQRALDQYANEQAAGLFARALELRAGAGEESELIDLSIGHGEALRRIGDPRHRDVLMDAAARARAAGDGERMGRALLASYRGTFSRALRVDGAKVGQLRAALRLIRDDRPTRARLLALLAVELVWAEDRNESAVISNEAVAVARRLDAPGVLAEVLAQRQWTVFHPIEARLATTEELRTLADSSSDPALRFEAASAEVFTAMRAGDPALLDRAMASARLCAAELRQPMVRWMLLIREAAVALMEARFADVAEHIAEGYQLALKTAQPDARAQRAVQRFWLDVDTQSPAAARTAISEAARNYRAMPPLTAWPPTVFCCCDLGLDELAAPILSELVGRGLDAIPVDQIWLSTLCQLAAAVAHLEERAIGADLLAVLTPHAAEHANTVFATMGSVARYIGLLYQLLGRIDDAERALGAAIEANAAMGAASWLARSRLDLAALRFDRYGRGDEIANRSLADAAAAAAAFGLATVAERAAAL